MTSQVLLSLLIMNIFFRCFCLLNILPMTATLTVSLRLCEHCCTHRVSIMEKRLEESLSPDELFETSVVESAAALPNVDNLTTCTCRGHCLREKGRNFCPCRSMNNFCSTVCHGDDFGQCMNNRRVQESDSEDTVCY